MARPKKNEEDKVKYQRVGIRYDTYLRLKELVKESKKINEKFTISDAIDSLILGDK